MRILARNRNFIWIPLPKLVKSVKRLGSEPGAMVPGKGGA